MKKGLGSACGGPLQTVWDSAAVDVCLDHVEV